MPAPAGSNPVGEVEGAITGGTGCVGRKGREVEEGGEKDLVGSLGGGKVKEEATGFGGEDGD